MPSFLHEALLLLFRNRPELAPELLRDGLGVALPAYTEARLESGDLTRAVPAELRADLVVLLVHGRPVLVIIVEAQLGRDERKRLSWPLYATSARARFRCPAVVLVVTASVDTARWAAEPIELGPASTFVVHVVGPDGAPAVTDPEAARRAPELAVFGAVAHGASAPPERAVALAVAALGAAAGLDDERALVYSDLVLGALGEAARRAMEELMATGGYEYQSEFAKKHRAEGRAEGRAEAMRDTFVRLLARRFGAIDAAPRERIAAASTAELERWIDRILTASSIDEVLAP